MELISVLYIVLRITLLLAIVQSSRGFYHSEPETFKFDGDHEGYYDHFYCNTTHRGVNVCYLENVTDWNAVAFNDISSLISHIQQITCMNVHLTEIPANFFETFHSTEVFEMSSIGLESIERNSFQGASSVTSLDLSRNKITALGNMVFYNLPKLVHLFLNGNQISTIKNAAFEDSSKNLLTVNLADNNIMSLSNDFFDSLNNKECNIDISNNKICNIQPSASIKTLQFNSINMSRNRLETFDYKKLDVKTLDLSMNKLQGEIKLENIALLDVANNNLTHVSIGSAKIVNISDNEFLRTISIQNVSMVTHVAMRNVSLDSSPINTVQHMSMLRELDLSYAAKLGPLKISDFAEMKSLKKLNLKRTGISNVTFGTFSHQRSLQVLDISDNALSSFNLHHLIGLLNLTELDISGNDLAKLERFENLRASFPQLENIGLENNNFSCSDLAKILESLIAQNIKLKTLRNVVEKSPNVYGIKCREEEKLSEQKAEPDNLDLDFEVLKSEVSKIDKDLSELKVQVSKNLTASMNEFYALLDKLNNVTQSKIEMADDKISQKLNEFRSAIAKHADEGDKSISQRYHQLENDLKGRSPAEAHSGIRFFDVIVVILVTVLITIGLRKVWKKFLIQNNGNLNRRGSTNTMQTDCGMEMRS